VCGLIIVNRSVVTLDMNILLRLYGLNKFDLDATLFAHPASVELMHKSLVTNVPGSAPGPAMNGALKVY